MNHILSQFSPGRAAVFNGKGLPFEMITRDVPYIKPGQVLVKTLYTTLCGSDVHTYCGRRQEPPHVVLGHEIAGDIVWIDPEHPGVDFRGEPIKTGDRITWSIFSVPAGIVAPREDMPQKSDQLFKYGHSLAKDNDVFNGGLAEYCVLQANTAIIKIDRDIPLKVAATISCAHSTVAGALRVAGTIPGKKILVFGAGLLGLSCTAMCSEAGAAWVGLADHDNNRLQWAKQFGVDEWYNTAGNAADKNFTWPEADIVFDMTGNADVMKMGIDSLAVGGCAVWIGAVYPAQPVQADAQKIVRKLLQIRGLHNYNYHDFVNATVFVEKHYRKYPFEDLVEIEFPLDDIDKAFAYAETRKPVRVGIEVAKAGTKT